MPAQTGKGMYRCMLLLVIAICLLLPASRGFSQSPATESAPQHEEGVIEGREVQDDPMTEMNNDKIAEGGEDIPAEPYELTGGQEAEGFPGEGEDAAMEDPNGLAIADPNSPATAESSMELKEDDYHYNPFGRRDPFYSKLWEDKKELQPNKKLIGVQRYDLSELKLVGIVWGALGRKGVVETPEGKSYLVKDGTPIGDDNGMVKAITNQEVVIQEFETDYLGNRIEKITVMKIEHKEQDE
ncbi:MAG: pilus assembly protein PilP [bacterium]